MSIQEIKITDQLASAQALFIQQNLLTSEYCGCCFSVDGEFYEIRIGDEEEGPKLFRADENLEKGSILVKDNDGGTFVQMIGHVQCQCGCFSDCHKRIDVHMAPGPLAGTVHYLNPSELLIKDGEGLPLFRLIQVSPPPPINSNLLKRASIVTDDAIFQIFSPNPEFPQLLANLRRKGRGQGWRVSITFEEVLDLEARVLILGAAFPIGLEYEATSVDRECYEKAVVKKQV